MTVHFVVFLILLATWLGTGATCGHYMENNWKAGFKAAGISMLLIILFTLGMGMMLQIPPSPQ